MNKFDLITILGATASGKTAVAAALAAHIDGEILSGDSRQIYRGMDIGTGKDLADYNVGGVQIPYHLIDIVDAGYKYNVFEYQRDFYKAYEDMKRRKKQAILCGGTGMYIESVVNAYKMHEVPADYELRANLETKTDAELIAMLKSLKPTHNDTDFDTRKRTIRAIEIEIYQQKHATELRQYEKINNIYFGIIFDVETRRCRITQRLQQRLNSGMIDEARRLLNSGISPDDLMYYGLEYKYLTLYLIGKMSYDEMFEKLNIAIRQFAKRQMTWFRGMERKGAKINWIDGHLELNEKLNQIERFL